MLYHIWRLEKMRNVKKVLSILLCVAASTLLIMCGPSGMNMLGDAMVDAGRMLGDGANDTSSDAQAQDSCATNCTSGGVLRVMTADTDPERLVGGHGRLERGGGTALAPSIDAATGPLILTDLVGQGWTTNSGMFNVVAYSLPNGIPCINYQTDQDPTNVNMEVLASAFAYTHQVSSFDNPIFFEQVHGASAFVPADRHLCIGSRYGGLEVYHWSGFRPYD